MENWFDRAIKGAGTILPFFDDSAEDAAKQQAKNLAAQQKIESERNATFVKLGFIGGAVIVLVLVVMMFRK